MSWKLISAAKRRLSASNSSDRMAGGPSANPGQPLSKVFSREGALPAKTKTGHLFARTGPVPQKLWLPPRLYDAQQRPTDTIRYMHHHNRQAARQQGVPAKPVAFPRRVLLRSAVLSHSELQRAVWEVLG